MQSRWSLAFVTVAGCLTASNLFAQSAAGGRNPEAQFADDAPSRDMARKQELVAAVASARESATGRKLSPALRAVLADKLLSVPLESLEAFRNAGGLGEIDALLGKKAGPRTLGDSAGDLIFTPVAPCRIINTTVAGGIINANSTRSFYVNGSAAGAFETQGGTAGGCGIPDDATAVEMNFVAVAPAGPGDFRAFPFSATPSAPLASIINYANVPGLNIANGLAQPVCNAATTTCTFDLIVQADAAASHLVVDVVGYYRKVDKAQVKSFAVFGTAVTSTPVTACGNNGGLQVTVNAPVAGQVTVTANATFLINHTTGVADEVAAFVGTTATSCPYISGFTPAINVPAALPTTSSYWLPVTVLSTFSVNAGSNTFFFNSSKAFGGTINYWTGRMVAQFIPN